MQKSLSSLPLLTVKGSPSEMGKQHGSAMRQKIAELAQVRTALLMSESGCSFSYLKSVAEQTWINICSIVPCIAEELESLSDFLCK